MDVPGNAGAPLVDTHFHIAGPGMPVSREAFYQPHGDHAVERVLAEMDRHGVLFGVAVAASLHGSYFDYARQALRAHRRLRATAIVEPDIGPYEMERMKEDGFTGIRFVFGHLDTIPDLDSDPYRRLFRRVADLGWHVHFNEREDRTPALIAQLERHGVRRIVVDHMGRLAAAPGIGGDAFRAILAGIERGTVWVKLSGGFRFTPPRAAEPFAQELLRVTGGESLMWGSDWPFAAFESSVTYADALETFRRWVPDPAVRHRIGSVNPLRFYFG